MASRTPAEDYLQSFRFRIFEVEGNADVFAEESPVAGFNNITTPNITIESAEHRTGNEVWTKKHAGVPTVEDCTMTRGILLGDTTFYDWVIAKIFGRAPYRTDLEIRVYSQTAPGVQPDDAFARRMVLKNCFPTSVKLIGDLDATSSDVNVQEITCAVEEVELDAPDSV